LTGQELLAEFLPRGFARGEAAAFHHRTLLRIQ
jgi:hypothetical protein